MPKAKLWLQGVTRDFDRDRIWLLNESTRSDQLGYPTTSLLNYFLDRGINLALLPQSFGGQCLPPTLEFELVFESAAISGTIGWIVFQMCGNTGRVLSFFPNSVISDLLNKTNSRIVIAYHTNPNCGRTYEVNCTKFLKGDWPFGSLAAVATHFAAPYISRAQTELCALVDSAHVSLAADWIDDGLKGTSTITYKISGHLLEDDALVAPMECANQQFLPWYAFPRAPIKHAAYGLGLIHNVIRPTSQPDTKGPARSRLCDLLEGPTAELTSEIYRTVEEVEKKVESQTPAPLLAAAFSKLEEINRHLHGWLLEVATVAYLTNKDKSTEKALSIKRNLADALAMSRHEAIRTSANDLLDYTRASPRLATLRRLLAS